MMTIAAFAAAAQNRNPPPPLRAPYNFVPLNEKVLPTPLSEEPDLGTPLEQGLSGELAVEWRVETPLLVGGNENNMPFRLVHDDATTPGADFAIPGASLRGMIRSVLEIMAYAHLDLVGDERFGFRDYDSVKWQSLISNPSLHFRGVPMTNAQGNTFTAKLPFAGWLEAEFEGDTYRTGTLRKCTYVEVSVCCIAAALDIDEDTWHRMPLGERHAELYLRGLRGVIDLGRLTPKLAGQHGTLVVSGRALRDPGQTTNKAKEVAFLDDDLGTSSIGQKAFDAFDAIQVADGNDHSGPPEENWSYWRPRLEAGERVPVFFRGDPAAAGNRVPEPTEFCMALTRLMRLPHRYTIHDRRRRDQQPLPETRLDFVQALFGHVPPEGEPDLENRRGRQRAWRSRVRFGLATLATDKPVTPLKARRALTMRPRASFWPFYLRPKPKTGPTETVKHPVDWSSDDARLAGRKRYPARNAATPELPTSPQDKPQQENQLVFLPASPGAPLVFRSSIRFTNLLPEELGGLVWAIGLGSHADDTTGHRRHMLGRAKAFGYGQVQAVILDPAQHGWLERNDGAAPPDLAACTAAFESWVADGLSDTIPFSDRPEIATLLALADADHGARLAAAACLTFSELAEPGATSQAERILAAYSTIKKRASCPPPKRGNQHQDRKGSQPIAREATDPSFLFLPEFPLPESAAAGSGADVEERQG